MSQEYRVIQADIRLPYNWALGKTWTKFFDCLKDEKIYGTKCEQCNQVFVPARPFCPQCYSDEMRWIMVGREGTLKSWTIVNKTYPNQPRNTPYAVSFIRLDGADCDFCHFIAGSDLKDLNDFRKTLKEGMRVRAVWKEEKNADILDISHFEPVKS